MRLHSPLREIGQQAVILNRGRMMLALLRKERLLAENTHLVTRLADRLLESYAYRASVPARHGLRDP